MKTKIKLLIILMAAFAISLVAGIAAGCSIGVDTQQDAADKAGMTASVTYYANGGTFSDNSICYKTMYFVPGNPIFNIGFDKVPAGNRSLSITRTNFRLVGWVEAELDKDGLPILVRMDGEGNATNEELDYKGNGSGVDIGTDNKEKNEQAKSFTAKVPENMNFVFEGGNPTLEDKEHKFLVAIWTPDIVLDYVLVSDGPVTFRVPNVDDPETEEDESLTDSEVPFESGSVIAKANFGLDGAVSLAPKTVPNAPVSDHSFIYLYWDEECTQPVNPTGDKVPRPTDGKNAVIYAKYIPGRWTPVSVAADVRGIFTSSTKFYIVRDIDCEDESFSLRTNTNFFNGTIEGNGFTLSNLNFSYSGTIGNAAIISMFGRIGDSAVINDVTFENVTLTAEVSYSRTVYIYALFNECAEGATFSNFSIDGLTMSITRLNETAVIGNIEYLDETEEYVTTNWLYGGAVLDSNFTEANGSVIKNATLIINEEIIVQEDINE